MDSEDTVSMQCPDRRLRGRGGRGPNKGGSVTTNMEEDIRDGSIAKSGRSKFSIYPAACGLPSVFFV